MDCRALPLFYNMQSMQYISRVWPRLKVQNMTMHNIKVFSYASCRIRYHTGLQCTKWQYKALDSAWNNIRGKFKVSRTKNLQNNLKVLTNEKRSGLTVILFERSRFQLFSLNLSNKSVQSSSCERPKTAQRTLFLSFKINNCFPIAV